MRRRPQQPAWSKSGSRTSPPSKYLFGNPCVQCNPCYAVARVRTPSRPAIDLPRKGKRERSDGLWRAVAPLARRKKPQPKTPTKRGSPPETMVWDSVRPSPLLLTGGSPEPESHRAPLLEDGIQTKQLASDRDQRSGRQEEEKENKNPPQILNLPINDIYIA